MTRKAEPIHDQCTLKIDGELYRQLRSYCDENGLRFADFVEHALEEATHLDEIQDVLYDEAELNEKIQWERQKAFRTGFSSGYGAAFLMANGMPEASDRLTPREIKDELRLYKTVQGGQVRLFTTE